MPTPPDEPEAASDQPHGCMRGTVKAPPGFDLTEPILDEPMLAAVGVLFE